MNKVETQILLDWEVMKHEEKFPVLVAEIINHNKYSNSSWYSLTQEAYKEWVEYNNKY